MKLAELAILADENVHPGVVSALKEAGRDVVSVFDLGMIGANDDDLLEVAHRQGRLVLTHDSDFGALAVQRRAPFTAIVFLRPGSISLKFTLEMLEQLWPLEVDVPFILVAERRGADLHVRMRRQVQPET